MDGGLMQSKVFQLLVDNTSGVLSRISGLFSRRGYNIESITAGTTADPKYTRITIVATGDDEILEQIEKQLRKLTDVRNIKELEPDRSVYRELAMIKVETDSPDKRVQVASIVDMFRAKVIDVADDSLIVEIVGNTQKVDAFIRIMEGYGILEIARTGIAGLSRGTEDIVQLP